MHEGEEMESALGAEKERREGKKEWCKVAKSS